MCHMLLWLMPTCAPWLLHHTVSRISMNVGYGWDTSSTHTRQVPLPTELGFYYRPVEVKLKIQKVSGCSWTASGCSLFSKQCEEPWKRGCRIHLLYDRHVSAQDGLSTHSHGQPLWIDYKTQDNHNDLASFWQWDKLRSYLILPMERTLEGISIF